MRLAATLCLLVPLLGGCSYVPATTAARLASFDPLTANADGVVVTLDLPAGVGVTPGSERLALDARRVASGEVSRGSYGLARAQSADGTARYRIAPEDLGRFTAQQALVRGWESADPDDTRGTLSVSLTPCRQGAGPGRRAVVSADIEIPSETKPLPLLRAIPVRRLLPNGTSLLSPCP